MAITQVKTVIVGCGMISDAYLSTMINKFKILDVVGCCDLDNEKAKKMAEKYNIKVYSFDQILTDTSIEIVVNLTNPMVHYSVIKQLLEAGKNVYTEKVLAVELAHAAELVEIADRNHLYLGAAPDTFLGSAIQTARFVVDSGMIGEVTSCTASFSRDGSIFGNPNSFTVKPGGGIGFDVGIYYLTALLSILGPVTEVSGIVRTNNPERKDRSLENYGTPYQVQCENLMAGTIQFENGAVGNLLFDANSVFLLPEKPSIVVYGTLGLMYMADPNSFGGDVKVVMKGNNEPFTIQQSHAYKDECRGLGVADMAWSIRNHRGNRASKEMAFHALEVLHGIVKSSSTKQNQTISSTFIKTPAIPRGYSGQGFFEFIEEYGLA